MCAHACTQWNTTQPEKKDQNNAICSSMDGPGDDHILCLVAQLCLTLCGQASLSREFSRQKY